MQVEVTEKKRFFMTDDLANHPEPETQRLEKEILISSNIYQKF